jgi:hypothetical protein
MNGSLHLCKKIVLLIVLLQAFQLAEAQEPLPEFTVSDKGGGRIIISWVNPFERMVQVAVQRSYDSVRRFSTIYSAPSPELPQNGFTDIAPQGLRVYYRIFYSLEGGAYFFTRVKRPGRDGTIAVELDIRRDKASEGLKEALKQPERSFSIKLADTIFTTLKSSEYTRFKDSILLQTKDTLFALVNDTILIKPYVAPYIFRTSNYVYPDREGYIILNLPDALTKKYDLIITEENDEPVFDIKHVKATYLTLDKADFYHSGWYKFELWEDGRLKEKNKFYLAKEF